MPPRAKQYLTGVAALAVALAIPALAQDRPESILPPGFGEPTTPQPQPTSNNAEPVTSPSGPRPAAEGPGVEIVDLLTALEDLAATKPVQ
jgi:hypothetical protein